jgi:hypothetical protein
MTLYEKRGRRYYPVHDTCALEGLDDGVWVVIVETGLTLMRKSLDARAQFQRMAASLELTKIIADELATHYVKSPTPELEKLTAKERRAIKAYQEVMGPDAMLCLSRPAIAEVAFRVAEAVTAKTLGGES